MAAQPQAHRPLRRAGPGQDPHRGDGREGPGQAPRFQNTNETRVAICNIVAGGVGITLTAASDVVFVEQSFVPGENAQAADRCHRIGQNRPVLVRVLSLAGSIDEVLVEVLARKVQMIREVIR